MTTCSSTRIRRNRRRRRTSCIRAAHLTAQHAHNDNLYLTATSLQGPWRRSSTGATRYLSPLDTDTCHSQSGEIIGPVGTANTYVTFFDRWFDGSRSNSDAPFPSPAPLMSHSRLIVQPLSFDGAGNVSTPCVSRWSLDISTGDTTPPAISNVSHDTPSSSGTTITWSPTKRRPRRWSMVSRPRTVRRRRSTARW